jgi:predicted TIM-barrel fold metal-dependent hydrolase
VITTAWRRLPAGSPRHAGTGHEGQQQKSGYVWRPGDREAAPISDAEREAICHGNAERIFGMS